MAGKRTKKQKKKNSTALSDKGTYIFGEEYLFKPTKRHNITLDDSVTSVMNDLKKTVFVAFVIVLGLLSLYYFRPVS